MNNKESWNFDLTEYIRLGEPSQLEKQKIGKPQLDYKMLMD